MMHANGTPRGDAAEDRERAFEEFFDANLRPQWEQASGPERVAILAKLIPADELAELVDAFGFDIYQQIWRKRHGM